MMEMSIGEEIDNNSPLSTTAEASSSNDELDSEWDLAQDRQVCTFIYFLFPNVIHHHFNSCLLSISVRGISCKKSNRQRGFNTTNNPRGRSSQRRR